MEDGKKFCFVICYNNDRYISECLIYIENLNVPDGYMTDIILISDARSMTEGYQRAMEKTNAKYIIYMHQDVFILEKNFLNEILNIFSSDEKIGMIGMVGTKKLPDTAVMWQTKERVGALRASIIETFDDRFDIDIKKSYIEVEAVDGLLIVTNRHDINWRTDIFDGWDFYDISQSTEYRRKGYKVVVPHQKQPWVLHDYGFLDMKDYNKYRMKYISEYISKK